MAENQIRPGSQAVASISYRTTGISPTQTAQRPGFFTETHSQWRDLSTATLFAFPHIRIQALSLFNSSASSQIFRMIVVGYAAIVAYTLGLSCSAKSEINAERENLPSAFRDVYWTISGSRHDGHRPIKGTKVEHTGRCETWR